jgi:hypothetical protein
MLPTVFANKTGGRLTQPTLTAYWGKVKARANLEFDFYLATKHMSVHRLFKLGLSTRAISAQMGWSEKAVEKLLRVYGHADVVALRRSMRSIPTQFPTQVSRESASDLALSQYGPSPGSPASAGFFR